MQNSINTSCSQDKKEILQRLKYGALIALVCGSFAALAMDDPEALADKIPTYNSDEWAAYHVTMNMESFLDPESQTTTNGLAMTTDLATYAQAIHTGINNGKINEARKTAILQGINKYITFIDSVRSDKREEQIIIDSIINQVKNFYLIIDPPEVKNAAKKK